MALEASLSICKTEPGAARDDRHIGPVAPAIGHERDRTGLAERRQACGEREIRVGDDRQPDAFGGQLGDTGHDGGRQSESWRPSDAGTVREGPGGDLVVVADHEDLERGGGGDHPRSQLLGERLAGICAEHRREAVFRSAEGLHGDEHAACRHPVCHLPTSLAVAMPCGPSSKLPSKLAT